jgi:hypothetical protein
MKIRQLCDCGSNLESDWQYDARGIFLCRTCPVCHQRKMGRYRKEVLTNSNYKCDEPIEPEDY